MAKTKKLRQIFSRKRCQEREYEQFSSYIDPECMELRITNRGCCRYKKTKRFRWNASFKDLKDIDFREWFIKVIAEDIKLAQCPCNPYKQKFIFAEDFPTTVKCGFVKSKSEEI